MTMDPHSLTDVKQNISAFNTSYSGKIMPNLDTLYKYILPILVIIGVTGNSVAILVLKKPTLQNYSIGFYLRVFAIMDILVLILEPGSQWTCNIFQLQHIPNVTDWLCRTWQFGWHVLLSSTLWIPVAMTFDRYIAIWQCQQMSNICNIFMAKVSTIIIFIGLVVINIHALWIAYLDRGICYRISRIEITHEVIWEWAADSLNSYIPLTMLLILDVAIILGIIFKGNRPQRSGQSSNEEGEMTSVSLAVCVSYLILAIPHTIIEIVMKDIEFEKMNQEEKIPFYFTMITFELVGKLNYMLLFFFCVALSTTFRTEFCMMIKTMCKWKNYNSTYELTRGNNETIAAEVEQCTETTPL